MVDSGATTKFLHRRFVLENQVATRKLARPILLYNIDGTENPVTTGCRVRSGRLTRTSRGVDEHLCSESGARLDSQAGDKMY